MKYIKVYEESSIESLKLVIKYPELYNFDILNEEPQEGDYVFIHRLYFLDNKSKLGKIIKKSKKWYSIDIEDGTNYRNDIKYIRNATPEEINQYKLLLQTNKYNL